jgi:hypothetical protein
VGSGKTLDVSAGTLTLAADQISGDKIQGGTIASTTITSLAATTVDTTNIEVTNIKALDGTAAATIAQSTGVITVPSAVLTTADINGGTIDATVIGGTTAAAITGVAITGTIVKGTTSLQTPLIEFTDGDDAITIADGGLVTVPNLTATTADINGGTIDATNVTVGSGKTLNVSAGTLTLADNQISGDKVEGGTIAGVTITTADINGGAIDGTTIGAAAAAAITGTTIGGTIISGSTSVRTPLIEFTDGDDAIAIADGGGVTIAKATAIGATTAGTGAFTTLTGTTFSSATVAHTIQAVTADGALDLTKTVHTLDASSATCQTTLANGTIAGQIKYIIAKDVSNATDVDLTTSLGAGATYTFQTVGECIQVLWTGAAWAVISVGANPTGTDVIGTIDVA